MDLGATLCKRHKPVCLHCPLRPGCQAYQQHCTESLPQRKQKARLPIRQATLLILLNHTQQVLLEKRPSNGIWGGLWSLPEFASSIEINQWCQKQQLTAKPITVLPLLKHSFTHFKLVIEPQIWQTREALTPPYQWVDLQQTKLGLPKPIRKLLQQSHAFA